VEQQIIVFAHVSSRGQNVIFLVSLYLYANDTLESNSLLSTWSIAVAIFSRV